MKELQAQKAMYCINPYEISRTGKFIETESRLGVCQGLGEEGNRECLLIRVSFWADENVLKLSYGGACIAL